VQALERREAAFARLGVGDDGAVRERVASVVTPRSTPTTGPLVLVLAGTACCACSTWTRTYPCPACSETVAERTLHARCARGRQLAARFAAQPD